MFTRILVAVSANSVDTILESAIDTAKQHDAHVFALHVVDPVPCWMGPMDYDFALAVQLLERHGREIIAQAASVLEEYSCPGETHMVTLPMAGQTLGQAIANAAESAGADLIILGQRKSVWWRLLGQDVASEVRRSTNTPIQILPRKTVGNLTRLALPRWSGLATADPR